MFAQLALDQRFDKPAKESFVDLINQSYSLQLTYGDVQIVSTNVYDGTVITTESIIERTTFATRSSVRVINDEEESVEYDIHYLRLGLAAYVYRHLKFDDLIAPHVLINRFATTPASAVVDALTYLKNEHQVQLDPLDCEIINDESSRYPDGSWSVVIVPKTDHVLWVGPLVLRGYEE